LKQILESEPVFVYLPIEKWNGSCFHPKSISGCPELDYLVTSNLLGIFCISVSSEQNLKPDLQSMAKQVLKSI